MGQETIPQTISTSYGDDEQTVPPDYATSVCNMFAQLGTMGISVLFASGDFGVGGGSCRSNDGKGSKKFLPFSPASCGLFFNITNTWDLLNGGCKAHSSQQLVARLSWTLRWRPTFPAEGFRLFCTSALPELCCSFIPPKHW